MIEEEHIRFVAAADVTDDCRIEVRLRKKSVDLTISQASLLVVELARAIREAAHGMSELVPDVEPASFDVAILSPDCRDGKDAACIGTAWDMMADQLTNCTCACHAEVRS